MALRIFPITINNSGLSASRAVGNPFGKKFKMKIAPSGTDDLANIYIALFQLENCAK